MPDPLPLAAAQARLGRPGRPRKHPIAPELGHSAGTATPRARPSSGAARRAEPQQGQVLPRLVDLHAAARYTGLSYWTLRELLDSGALPRVRLEHGDGRPLRRVLLDVRDLDRWIEQAKDTGGLRDGR
jgi:hypothetical protein